MKKQISNIKQPINIYYEQTSTGIRWWQTNWASDQFDIITFSQLQERLNAIKLLEPLSLCNYGTITNHLPEE